MLKVVNDVIMAAGNKQTTVVLLLNISAAFNTINFSALFERTSGYFGISDSLLDSLWSFVTGCSLFIGVRRYPSASRSCLPGVSRDLY